MGLLCSQTGRQGSDYRLPETAEREPGYFSAAEAGRRSWSCLWADRVCRGRDREQDQVERKGMGNCDCNCDCDVAWERGCTVTVNGFETDTFYGSNTAGVGEQN